MTKEKAFELWFHRSYKPHPSKDGWYIDKIISGAMATVEGAKAQFEHIYPLAVKRNELHILTGVKEKPKTN